MDDEHFSSNLLELCKNPVDFGEYENIIMKPLNYLAQKPHKYLGTYLKACNHWFKLPKEKLELVKELCGYIVDSTTTIDDIVDNAQIVRGQPPAHIVFGVPATLMNCEYANFKFLKAVKDINGGEYLSEFIDCALNGYKGQAIEIYWRENSICPTFKEYIMMANAKTTIYAIFTTRLMQAFSDNKKDYHGILCLLGFFFQLRNDYRNLFMPEEENNNEIFADDLTEGKCSLPLIHAIRVVGNEEVAEIFKQRPTDLETKRKCVKILREIGSQKYCLGILNDLAKTIKTEVKNFDENPIIEFLVDMASDFNNWKSEV